jgi:Ser/Thr protein kinase RdoA (MazF antagonist)
MMHDQGFAHNDLKWRNILVDEKPYPNVFMIDCPSGAFWWGPLLEYRMIKDLACLDKLGKQVLSRTQRLRFYHDYAGRRALTALDKKRIKAVAHFFRGRE